MPPCWTAPRDLETLLRDAPAGVAPERVGRFIARLDEAGLLTLGPPPSTGAGERARAYWEAAGTAASNATGNRVQVIATGNVDPGPALAALREAGVTVRVGPTADPAELTIVLCDDYLSPELADIDAAHRAARRPWLLAKLVGARVWLGPVFEQRSDRKSVV